MKFRASIILGLLLCTQSGVFGVSLFNFWSHILPQGPKSEEISNSVTAAASGEDETDCGPGNATTANPLPKAFEFSSEEKIPRITELLNPMSWFKRTPKVNSFEINAELGTVRV